MKPVMLRHNKVDLALHALRAGEGRPLLLLHGLGERSPSEVPAGLETWPGPVHALDFTGHGASSIPTGGGYTCEILMADADHALAHLGPATLVGRGLGAYVALLIAGARPQLVHGAILRDGPGLGGGGATAPSPYIAHAPADKPGPPDPLALAELSHDVRPPDYAMIFVRAAIQNSPLPRPLSVCARERTPWLSAAVDEIGIEPTSTREALEYYARRA